MSDAPSVVDGESNLVNEVESGDRIRALKALRLRLAVAVEECRYLKDLPPLVRRLESVMADLERLGAGKKVTKADELRKKREQREAAGRTADRRSAGGSVD